MKTKLLYKIPLWLIYSRLIIAIIIILCSFLRIAPEIIIAISIAAIISDVLDGIIARRLNISTPDMRQLDTKTDTVFWFSCLFYLCINHTPFLKTHIAQILILVSSELFIIVFGMIKFNERISYHTILSKCWALCLLWFFIDLILGGSGTVSFTVSFWYGLLVQLEILLIAFILKKSQTDIPSLIQAVKLNKGIPVKKNRFFNG